MNESWNKLGVYRMDMVVEQDTLFTLQMDSCSFDQRVCAKFPLRFYNFYLVFSFQVCYNTPEINSISNLFKKGEPIHEKI